MTVIVTNRKITIGVTTPKRVVQIGAGTARAIESNRPSSSVTVEQRGTQVRVEDQTGTRVDTGGRQGIPGRDGQDAGLIERRALTAIGGHVVVRSLTAQLVEHAAAIDDEHGDDTLGITTNAAAPGNVLNIQRSGALTMSGWNWTQGDPVFVGLDPGTMTQTAPDPAAGYTFSQIIGFAESATSIFIDIQPPIYF